MSEEFLGVVTDANKAARTELEGLHHHVLVEGADPAARPLLLLHGSGGCEDDLVPLAGAIAGRSPAIGIRGSEVWEGGFAFFRRLEDRSVDEGNLVTRALSLAGFIEAACLAYGFSQPPVAVGFSNGAIMSAALLALRPGLLGGAILLRPLLPFVRHGLGPLDGVPVLAIDGEHDTRRLRGDGLRVARWLADAGACVEHHVLATGHGVSSEDRRLAEGWLGRLR